MESKFSGVAGITSSFVAGLLGGFPTLFCAIKITSAIVVALLMTSDVAAISLTQSPINNQAVQMKSQSRNQLVIEANN